MNKMIRYSLCCLAIIMILLIPVVITTPVRADGAKIGILQGATRLLQATDTVTPPTATTTDQVTRVPSERPLVIIQSYNSSVGSISANQTFELTIKLKNIGSAEAKNLIATIPPGDVVPLESGGVLATTELDPGENKKFNQPMTATYAIIGKTVATVLMQITYTDPDGVSYSETFNLTIPVTTGKFVPTSTPTSTPTTPPPPRPQLVITSYNTNVSPLEPGTIFSLDMEIDNKGNANAKQVSMILGGGEGSQGAPQGTPEAGGVSGGSGDFGNFAPVSSSNVQFLGDIDAGSSKDAQSTLIVNASTEPGAYPMIISFTYVDERGQVYTDDQAITLLVYQSPNVDVNFYRPPDPLFAGQQGVLPVQVVNLGRSSVVLGNMTVDGAGGQYSNNSILVGALDVGGYFTLDASVIPDQPGPMEVIITIDYTDDFNQAQVLTDTLSVNVEEMTIPEPNSGEGGIDGEGIPVPEQPETLWQKVIRFIKGLFGLDSGVPTQPPGELPPADVTPEQIPPGIKPAQGKG